MFQHLLEDEFKLQFHKDIEEGPVYVLAVDKDGSKMKLNETPEDFGIPIKGGGEIAGPPPDELFSPGGWGRCFRWTRGR